MSVLQFDVLERDAATFYGGSAKHAEVFDKVIGVDENKWLRVTGADRKTLQSMQNSIRGSRAVSRHLAHNGYRLRMHVKEQEGEQPVLYIMKEK